MGGWVARFDEFSKESLSPQIRFFLADYWAFPHRIYRRVRLTQDRVPPEDVGGRIISLLREDEIAAGRL
jgi:hypothetical protein